MEEAHMEEANTEAATTAHITITTAIMAATVDGRCFSQG